MDKQLHVTGTLNGSLSSSNGGVETDLSDLPVQLPVEAVDALNALGGTWQLAS